MSDTREAKRMGGWQLSPKKAVPGVLWIGLVSLGLITVPTLIGAFVHPHMFVAVILNCAIFMGLYNGHKWAYGLTIAFCLLGPLATLLLGNVLGNVLIGLFMNGLVLVPVLLCTDYFFTRNAT